MRLATLTSLLLLLLCVKAQDSYTACKCVRRRLQNRPCPNFVRHAVPQCAPLGDWSACQALCCASCRLHGDHWPVCRSAMLRKICRVNTATTEDDDDDDHDDDDRSSGTAPIGPKMQQHDEIIPSAQPDVDPSGEPAQSPEELMPSPVTTESMEPTPDTPKNEMSTRDNPQAKPKPPSSEAGRPTAATDKDVESSPDTAGNVEPPFDATNEGELDLTPATDGRPFAPAACACMSKGKACDGVLAAASGVCEAGVEATSQGGDCHFACCRICIVNMYATFCDDEPIREACGL